ncbi:hypothetical protein B0J11DRAFT_515805 [Dendryphion nanum]|uniref:DUF3328 domain-containing protein n=1 Tax=Dendryphion nanum TaxID=256645 RepID=A0A9P9EK81_9PLEO|nr:hypothetical protein B0J11DRAFT_515805 [Dendryphion nanum]
MPKFKPFQSTFNLSSLHDESNKMKDDHRYDALRNLDNHSDSSTEVEDWEPESEVQTRKSRRRKGFWRKLRSYRWVVDTALLLVVVGLLVEKRWKHHKSHKYEFTGDLTGFAPKFSQQIVKFKPDSRFAPDDPGAFWDKETQQAWLSIVPEGLGYVNVKNPSEYDNLPQPIHDYPNHTVYTTSMTHQLHCLYTILDAYNLVLTTRNPAIIEMPWHINHCFEYMRQAVMCAGDVALEGAATSFPLDKGEDRGGSDGWDAQHVCKDYGEIYKYLEKETINHNKWIST